MVSRCVYENLIVPNAHEGILLRRLADRVAQHLTQGGTFIPTNENR